MCHLLKFLKHSKDFMNTLLPHPTMDLLCHETFDEDEDTAGTQLVPVEITPRFEEDGELAAHATLRALITRRMGVNPTGMLASNYYFREFGEWVNEVWNIVHDLNLNHQIAYIAVRTFTVLLSVTEVKPWPLLKWERYACIWIALKMEEHDADITHSIESFLEAMFGGGWVSTYRSEHNALRIAERKVLQANNFTFSYPLPSDFAYVLLDVLGSPQGVRTTTFVLLASLTRHYAFATEDPLLVATACIHHVAPEHTALLVELTGCKLDDVVRVIAQWA